MKTTICMMASMVLLVGLEGRTLNAHIRVGNIIEGYNLCGGYSRNDEVEMPDFGKDDYGPWQDAYKVVQPNGKNTFPVTLYNYGYAIGGGKLEMAQTFSRDAARRELSINMKFYNRTGEPFGFTQIRRVAGFDINNTSTNDVFTIAGTTVIACDFEGGAMSLSGGIPEIYKYRSYGGGGCSLAAANGIHIHFYYWKGVAIPLPVMHLRENSRNPIPLVSGQPSNRSSIPRSLRALCAQPYTNSTSACDAGSNTGPLWIPSDSFICLRRLIQNKPVEPHLFNSGSKLLEVYRLAHITVDTHVIARRNIRPFA